jgi:hypothetical protein
MPSIVTIGHFDDAKTADVTKILQEFDKLEAPGIPQLRRRQLFTYSDLYIELQDWAVADVADAHNMLATDSRLMQLAADLKEYFREYIAAPTWDGPIDQPTAQRFYLWPTENLPDLEQRYSAIIVNTQLHKDIPEVSRLFAESDATDFPHKMGTLRRQIYLYRGIYLHIQDFANSDSREIIDSTWKMADPRFLKLVDDLTAIIPPYDAAGGQLATRCYRWAAE